MSSSARLFLMVLVAGSLLHPATATADPIQLTHGFLRNVGPSLDASFQLISHDFLSVGITELGEVSPVQACTPCVAGDPVGLSSRFFGLRGPGPALFEGTFYPQVYWDGQLFFDAPTVLMPPTAGDFAVTDRFTFHGDIIARTGPFENSMIAFQTPLAGQGTVFARFRSLQQPGVPPLIVFQDIRYDFEPVPEPGTLFLVAAGLGAALRARNRARGRMRAGR